MTIYRMCNGNQFLREQFEDLGVSNLNDLGEAIEKNKFPKRDAFLPHIPNSFQQIIKKAIHPDVQLRYENVLDMMNDISKVDCEFEWYYNEYTNVHSCWFKENDTHEFFIELKYDNDNGWHTEGKKVRKSDGLTRRVANWKVSGYNTKTSIYKKIKQMLY